MADLKKANPSRIAALLASMQGGQGAGGPPSTDVMDSPANEPPGNSDTAPMPDGPGEDAQSPNPAPGASDESQDTPQEASDPVGSLQDAQEAIQQALGSSTDPKSQQELSQASQMIQQASAILQKYYEASPDGQDGDLDDEEAGPAGQSEGTQYEGDSK